MKPKLLITSLLWHWPVTIIVTTIASIACILAGFLPQSVGRWTLGWIAQSWGRTLVWTNFGRVRLYDHEIYSKEAMIYMSNHLSWVDVPVLLGTLPRGLCFLSKKEVFKVPLMGRAMKALGFISIDRQNRHQAIRSVEGAGERIQKEKLSVWIAPEGTRSVTGELGVFKKGPFHLAIQSKVPIVPVLVTGTNRVLPKHKILAHGREPMEVIIGKEIRDHINRDVTPEELADIVKNAIVSLRSLSGTKPAPCLGITSCGS